MPRFLIIQTAFIGDVILATAVIEKIHQYYPDAGIDFLLRKGNESLLQGHPYINKLWIWDKKKNKQRNLLRLAFAIRKERYTHVINLHRFTSSGLITCLSKARYKAGFDKNPFAFCYTKKVKHIISQPYSENPVHEIQRNQSVITDITDSMPALPKLYPSQSDYDSIKSLQPQPYICIAPSSVWFTKQFPEGKWADLINDIPGMYQIYLLGAPGDTDLAERIISKTKNNNVKNLCGKLDFLQSAALMKNAEMNYANDSAPLHLASAVNAPATAVFCSTVPAFGFGPLSEKSKVVEIKERLYCRPCGLHGLKTCPEGHFRCALEITNEQLLWWNSKTI
ncbi:MAG TPA: glycosyltransferase family 9 protein [Flavipsychrobacter sp.]|nr:glycosyltransferase family 9 protein [Flavipsychrobacter sp.]